MSRPVIVVPYDSDWPQRFAQLKDEIWPVVEAFAETIEHVGSTSVPGLAAKPIIDLDVIVPSEAQLLPAIRELELFGYSHLGDLGIKGREAVRKPEHPIAHNLYVCPVGAQGLLNHLAVRDYLRSNLQAAQAYGQLKLELAEIHRDDIDAYVEAKSQFIQNVLRECGFAAEDLSDIEAANRKK